MNYKLLAILFFLLTMTLSCKFQENKIIPFAEPQTISEIQQAIFEATNGKEFQASSTTYYRVDGDKEHFYLKLRYNMEKITSKELESASQELSEASKSLMGLFAKIFFSLGGKKDIEVPPISFKIPELDYDKEVIVDVTLTKISLEFLNKRKGNNFKFIEKLKLLMPNREIDKDEVIVSYNKKNNECNYQCLDFDISKTSLVDLIENRESMTVKTELKIDQLPKNIDLKFKGYIELFVKLKLPF